MHEDYRFVDFWIQGQKTTKSSLMGLVLMTSGAKTRKSSNRASFLGLVLSTSAAKARKSSNRVSWDSFCRLLEPRLKSHQIELPGSGEHFIIGSLFIVSSVWGPPSTHRASEGPTKNMCLRKSVSIIICPLPLSHPTLYFYLQSRHTTKCNVLML